METHLHQELASIKQSIITMASIAEEMIDLSIRMLEERNEELRKVVSAKETRINSMQLEVDETAISLIARMQPMASDLRFLVMVPKITSELERIGDHAINICQNASYLIQLPKLKSAANVSLMEEAVRKMLKASIDSFVNNDAALAQMVLQDDARIDAAKEQIMREMMTYVISDPPSIQRAISFILIAKNLERIGDLATNIAEEVIYFVEGSDIRHHHEVSERERE